MSEVRLKPETTRMSAKTDKLKEIADHLVAECNAGRDEGLLKTHYASKAVSVEASPMPDGSRESEGVKAIQAKGDWWRSAHTVHKVKVEGPFLHGEDRFAVIFDMDVTQKSTKQRMKMREVGLYTVARGKIVREEFFYAM
jgi:hypothetical protein